MGAHVLLNLLNELREKDKMRGFATTSLRHFICNFAVKHGFLPVNMTLLDNIMGVSK